MAAAPARYLVFFQYLGTRYSGVMETKNDQALVGVQNYLEASPCSSVTFFSASLCIFMEHFSELTTLAAPAGVWKRAAERLKPSAPIKFHISSRTDAGVHALANAAHLDIQRPPGKAPFSSQQLVQGLNHHLRPEPIRILSAQRVSSTFHARFCALSRTYIYRLLLGCAHHSQIPVFEQDLCWAPAGGPLDVAAMREAAQFLLGTHDFSSFRSLHAEAAAQSPVRTLLQLQLQPAPGFLQQHYLHSGLEFWEVKVKSRSFLYRQVRRMVGALVAVGQGRLAPAQLRELLELRDPRAFPPHAMAPAAGLFLQRVEYSPEDLASPPAEEKLCGLS
nr:tRNA pseudouridine synthase-like 1 isoform X1 [Taeniopygia guttata]XP_041576346.1 tRNA pseudouridine synthase-like 1 isoform X1 [Taeniopygia guttata]